MLILPLGVPGAGKTTLLGQLFPTARHVNKDASRREIAGPARPGDYTREERAAVWEHYRAGVVAALHSSAQIVIADANHGDRDERLELAQVARAVGRPVHLWVFANVDQAVGRYLRPGRHGVPGQSMTEWGFARALAKYRLAVGDIKGESYDVVVTLEQVGPDPAPSPTQIRTVTRELENGNYSIDLVEVDSWPR